MRKSLTLLMAGVLTTAALPSEAAVKTAKVVESLKLKGDLRLRHESFFKNSFGQTDRHRERFRLRLAANAELPHDVSIDLRLASGVGEQTSTNQTFDNLSKGKSIFIDRVSLTWAPRPSDAAAVRLTGGRMANPFWLPYSSDVVWDTDVNPEGFAQSAEWLLGGSRFFVHALEMVADEDSGSTKDQWMIGGQAGGEVSLPGELRLEAAAAYYEWLNEGAGTFGQAATGEGNRRAAGSPGSPGVLLNEFGVGQLTAVMKGRVADIPFLIDGTFVKNLEARDSVLTPAEDTGFQVGAKLGSAKRAGGWEAAYYYKRVETDATVADVADADFGDGGTNRKGSIVWLGYALTDWAQLKAKVFVTQVLNTTLAPGPDDITRLQFDTVVKF